MIQEEELLEKVDEWQSKAKAERDPFNKYVSIFIAYNIFYNLYARKKLGDVPVDFTYNDSKRATATISLVETANLFQLIESDLREYIEIIPVFREEYWPRKNASRRVPISDTLKMSFRAKNKKETIDMLIKWLYKVRCNLVHGEKSYRDDKQKELLGMSSILLDKILQHLKYRYNETMCCIRASRASIEYHRE